MLGSFAGGLELKQEGNLLQIPGYILIVLGFTIIILGGWKFYKGSGDIYRDLLKEGVIHDSEESNS